MTQIKQEPNEWELEVDIKDVEIKQESFEDAEIAESSEATPGSTEHTSINNTSGFVIEDQKELLGFPFNTKIKAEIEDTLNCESTNANKATPDSTELISINNTSGFAIEDQKELLGFPFNTKIKAEIEDTLNCESTNANKATPDSTELISINNTSGIAIEDQKELLGFPVNTKIKAEIEIDTINCKSTNANKTVKTICSVTKLNKKTSICSFCDYSCKDRNTLARHLKVHTTDKPFACQICDFRTKSHEYLHKHNMRVHTAEKKYACEMCDYKTATNDNLTKHKMRTHTHKSQYACQMCDYKTAYNNDFVIHLRRHTGDKPFACQICDYRTTSRGSLKTHMRIHTGEKPFACQMCDYRTAKNTSLAEHMRKHSVEKSFTCHVCGYRAAHQQTLTKHMFMHTREKQENCT